MKMTTAQEKNLDALSREFASSVFGIDYIQDIRNIPEQNSGPYQIRDDINIDDDYIYQTLYLKGKAVASNNPENRPAHGHFIKKATGRVLISGLGLGDSLHEILQKKEVEYVRVVEKGQDIINMVAPFFPEDRVEIVQGDIFDYPIHEQFDCVYHALWNDKESALAAKDLRQELKSKFDDYCSWQGFIFISSRGGKRKGAGRQTGSTGANKPENAKRVIRKGIRYRPTEFEIIKQACKISGKSESEIALAGAVKEATRIIFKLEDPNLDKLVKKTIEKPA